MVTIVIATVLSVCLIGGGIVYLVVKPLLERYLALQEEKLRVQAQRINRPAPAKNLTMPLEMVVSALQEKEDWAKADKLKWLQEKFEETGSWDSVNIILGQRN